MAKERNPSFCTPPEASSCPNQSCEHRASVQKPSNSTGCRFVSCHSRLVSLCDHFLALFVFAPLCVLYWRGTWQLANHFLLPSHPAVSAGLSASIGYIVTWTLVFFQKQIYRWVASVSKTPCSLCREVILSRLYTALFGFGLVNLWRGVWDCLNLATGVSAVSGFGSAAAGVVCLALLRTLRNIIAPPLIVAPDFIGSYFRVPTMFKMQESGKVHIFMLDVMFSVVVVGSLVVFVWRGVWVMLDILLFPDNKKHSAWTTLVLGYLITLIAYPMQFPAAALSRLLSTVGRILFEDIYIFISTLGAIAVWRGVWMLADVYIFPDNEVLSNLVTHVMGFLGLLITYNTNTILARGVYIDGIDEDGTGCHFDTQYFRKLFKTVTQMGEAEESMFSHQTTSPEKRKSEKGSSLLLDGAAFGKDEMVPMKDINRETMV